MQAATAVLDSDSRSASEYYERHGYVVVPQLIPSHLIDALLRRYARDIFASKKRFFRQSTDAYEANRVNDGGYVAQSFLDIHAYRSFPEFREAALALFFCESLQRRLSSITGGKSHNLMQSMLFDANTQTPPHQDWWYLDSVPNGELIACWIALEDIHADAGRFFVMPDSHELVLHDREKRMSHSDWLARMRNHVDTHLEEIQAPALKAGDVLFWNSRTIHGSLATRDVRHSRKSLTAHFLPGHLSFGNLFTVKPWVSYERYGEHLCFANQPEYSLRSKLISRLKVSMYDHPQLLKLARRFQRGGVSDY